MAGPVIHWDDVRDHPVQQGELDATFANLGAAAGTIRMGMRRERISSGMRALPPHVHTVEEEILYVLGGSGISWQDGLTHDVTVGDCLLHLPRAGCPFAHRQRRWSGRDRLRRSRVDRGGLHTAPGSPGLVPPGSRSAPATTRG